MRQKATFTAILMVLLAPLLMAAPASLVQSVTYDGETITMRLDRQDLRGSNFELWSQNAAGTYDVITPVTERSYLGTIDGYPGAVSCGIQLDDGTFKGAAYFRRGATWFTLGTSVVSTRALDYHNFTNYQYPAASTVTPGQAGSSMYGFDLGVDADYNYFTNAGSSVATALEGIEYSVAVIRGIYMRDALLRPYLGRVIIRSTLAQDPYTSLTQGDYLSKVRTEWNTNQTTADRDVVAGVSPTKIGGGLAWVGVIASSSAYSVSQSNSEGNFDVVFRHELGHNWGCGHYVGGSPEGTGLMGGNAAGRFTGCETHRVLNERNNELASMDDEGTYTAVELPPYASLDVEEILLPSAGPITIDVLANDHDANGQSISLTTFDSTSAKGGTVSLQGQDLLYDAPGNLIGSDSFTYTITDSFGSTATGAVVINLAPDAPLHLYLPLDESTGTSADDLSIYNHPTSFSGTDFGTTTGPGTYGNAVTLDGTDDHFTASGMQLNSNTVTMTAWIKRGATQPEFAGIIFDRSSGGAGFNFGSSNELRYHWNNNNWSWSSGLVPPADTWTFVALVIEPNQATIYMNSGSGFQSSSRSASHSPEIFGTTYIGTDPNNGSRHYNGGLDEVRIYDQAMSQAELQSVYDGGAASAPNPFDGATDVSSAFLSWAPGATATGYDIYIGTNEAAVGTATQASPEFQETTLLANHVATLADQTTYYWRVDTLTSGSTISGTVWSFTTAVLPIPGNSILVNFGRNSNEVFAGGELIGPTSVDSSNWNSVTGAQGSLSGLVDGGGASTGAEIQWFSANTWSNDDGTASDESRLAVGYLDDGEGSNADGKGVIVTINNIPYSNYKVYGLFATDQNGGGSSGTVNFDVNGTWALGGTASTTASAWGSVSSNNSANGSSWTEIVPGAVQGNYWVVDSSGSTCTITGEIKNGNNRGCLTAVIIENVDTNSPPSWDSDPVNESGALEGSSYSSTLADDASDPDAGDSLSFEKVSGPAWLSVATDGTLSGTPQTGDVGPNAFVVKVTDLAALEDNAALNISVLNVNDPPAFTSNPIVGSDGTQGVGYTSTLVGTVSDPDSGDSQTFEKVSGPNWLVVASGGGLSGVPTNGDVGSNAFSVKVTDGGGLTDTTALTIQVINVNDPPAFDSDPLTGSNGVQDAPYTGTLASSASDPDSGEILSFNKVSGPSWLSVGTDGALTGTPTNGDIGPNVFVVRVSDDEGLDGTATLNIEVDNQNDGPSFTADPIALGDATEDSPYTASVASFATDPDVGDTLSFVKVSGPAWLLIATDGSISGTPVNNDVGATSAVVRVSDLANETADATVNLSVINTNDPPAFDADPVILAGAMEEEPFLGQTLADSASDPDAGDTLTFAKLSGPAWLNVATDGTLTGTPPADSAGTEVFTVRVTDAEGSSVDAGLEIDVIAAALSLPWQNSDLGGAGSSGSATDSSGVFSVAGSGRIIGLTDQFQFAWQAIEGDATITARVHTLEDTGADTRVGIMIRDTLGSNSRHVFFGVDGSGAYRWVRRSSPGAYTATSSSGTSAGGDAWMRLQRQNGQITVSKSLNGTDWVLLGSLGANLPSTCYFGLAVASGDTLTLNHSKFDSVTVSP